MRPIHRPRAFTADSLSPRLSPRPRAKPASRGPCHQRARTDRWFPARLRGRDDSFLRCAVCVFARSVVPGRAAQAHGAEASKCRGLTPRPALPASPPLLTSPRPLGLSRSTIRGEPGTACSPGVRALAAGVQPQARTEPTAGYSGLRRADPGCAGGFAEARGLRPRRRVAPLRGSPKYDNKKSAELCVPRRHLSGTPARRPSGP